MKKLISSALITAILTVPAVAQAETIYIGGKYGKLLGSSDDKKAKVMGFTAGLSTNSRTSFEVDYMQTTDFQDGLKTSNGTKIEATKRYYSGYGVTNYRLGSFPLYLKGKAGFSYVELESNIADTDNDIVSSFGFGAAYKLSERMKIEAEFSKHKDTALTVGAFFTL